MVSVGAFLEDLVESTVIQRKINTLQNTYTLVCVLNLLILNSGSSCLMHDHVVEDAKSVRLNSPIWRIGFLTFSNLTPNYQADHPIN